MRNKIILLVLLLANTFIYSQDETNLRGGRECQTKLETENINDNKLIPIDGVYYYRYGAVDYKGVLDEYLRIITDETIKLYKTLPEFKCVEFKETTDSTLAHFDMRIGDNAGTRAPIPPEWFNVNTLAYTWGVYQFPQYYHNQVWFNLENVATFGNDVITLAHEWGHRFNFAHSEDFWAVMYFAMHNQADWNEDDLLGFKYRYSFLLDICEEITGEEVGPDILDSTTIQIPIDSTYCKAPYQEILEEYGLLDLFDKSAEYPNVLEWLDDQGIYLYTYKAQRVTGIKFKTKVVINGKTVHRTRAEESRTVSVEKALQYILEDTENLQVAASTIDYKRCFFLSLFVVLFLLAIIIYQKSKK